SLRRAPSDSVCLIQASNGTSVVAIVGLGFGKNWPRGGSDAARGGRPEDSMAWRPFEQQDGTTLVVGRASVSDLPVFDPTISRRHAELTSNGLTIRVRDLGSSN